MLHVLPWPFDTEFMILALVAGLIVSTTAPLVGVFLVHKRMSLYGDGVGHVAFAGVAAGILLHAPPVLVAAVAAAVAALAVERTRSRGNAPGDLALALVFYSGIAAAVVLLSLARSLDASVLSFLFGSILTVAPRDLIVVSVVGIAVIAFVALFGHALLAIVVDEDFARVAGLPVNALNSGLAVLAALTVVASMRVVGVLLVAALMVLPVASARVLASSFRSTLLISSVVGAISVLGGLTAARVWGLAPGGTIVLVAGLFAGTARVFRSRKRPGALAASGGYLSHR